MDDVRRGTRGVRSGVRGRRCRSVDGAVRARCVDCYFNTAIRSGGREAILGQWTRLFARYDTSAWRTERVIVDVHGDLAYTLSTYSEILVPRDAGAGVAERVVGRLVLFLRREPDGEWLVTVALNSHVRPVEPA